MSRAVTLKVEDGPWGPMNSPPFRSIEDQGSRKKTNVNVEGSLLKKERG